MQPPIHQAAKPDVTLDLEGLKCPLPVLRARKAMVELPPGALLKVIATDPMAAVDLPHFCAETGHILEAQHQDGDRLIFLIRRGA